MAKAERDYSRLPKWARDEIRVLKQNVQHWKGQALAATGEGAGAPILVGHSTEHGLPDEIIRFYPDPSDRGLYVQVRLDGDGIDVNATRPVVLRMRSSNSFQVEVVGF